MRKKKNERFSDEPRPKKVKNYTSRNKAKSKLKKWEDTDWEELGSNRIEQGDYDARDDRE